MKSDLQTWLSCADFEKVLDAVLDSNRIIGTLISLTYSDDILIRWRAIDAIGRCAMQLALLRPKVLTKYLRRLFWMMTDESGSISLHAPEVIGEIVRSDPKEFADFIPLTVTFLDLEPEDKPKFLPGILYALGRIGEVAPGFIVDRESDIEKNLADPNARVRAMAAWCLARNGCRDLLLQYPELEQDVENVHIYKNKSILNTTVGKIYSEESLRASF